MKTLQYYTAKDCHYHGGRRNWLVAYTTHRDADVLTRSNFRALLEMLGAKNSAGSKGSETISDTLAIEEFNHWAVGWIQYLLIDPTDIELVTIANDAIEKMSNYPILDDEDFCNLEMEDANQIWQNCYNARERIKYIRENKNQFDFNGFSDLIACVRGKYFAGYASELIN